MDPVRDSNRSSRTRRRLPSWAFWVVWVVGPASYGLAFAYCSAYPELCNDPPNLLIGCCLILTHLLAALGTVALIVLRGLHRRHAEFLLLLFYWAGIAGWIFGSSFLTPQYIVFCVRASAALVVVIPLVGLVRMLLPD